MPPSISLIRVNQKASLKSIKPLQRIARTSLTILSDLCFKKNPKICPLVHLDVALGVDVPFVVVAAA